ncbi:MAG: helix-turn-helix transcriptional regulator [Thalassotalea sp.]|nr:helix-turn-helix transcriptional regulator [Thalassotalea sp.]
MENLNVVNLIQASTVSIGILGGLLLWLSKAKKFRGISILLFCIALSAFINILEETGLTRDIYLISPVFIMLFGPVIYLAAKLLIDGKLARRQYWHLLPIIPFLYFTSYTYTVIGVGTLWRLVYALLTVSMLLKYKRSLDQERSDSDDFSLNWLVWLLAITSIFNIIDLIRLNIQSMLPYDINVLGQGINNGIWLVASTMIIIKIQLLKQIPQQVNTPNISTKNIEATDGAYNSIFQELDKLMISKQWFLKPRLTLADVSNLTGLQTRDISRAINLVTTKSFNEYINNYRVNFVYLSLANDTHDSLSNIAANAGFSSKASFNKVFKQISGQTPTEYKSQQEA